VSDFPIWPNDTQILNAPEPEDNSPDVILSCLGVPTPEESFAKIEDYRKAHGGALPTLRRIDPVMCPTCFGTFDCTNGEAETRRLGYDKWETQCPHCKRWREDERYDRFHTAEAIARGRTANAKVRVSE
jgi:hypothetical protein